MLICSITWIPLLGQITLSKEQAQFYSKALVDRQTLQADTASLRSELRDCDSLDVLRQKQLKSSNFEINQRIQIAENYKLNYDNLSLKHEKSEKRLRNWRKAALIISAIAISEVGVIYFIIK